MYPLLISIQLNHYSDLKAAVASKTNFTDASEKMRILDGLRWIGLFSDEQITPAGTPLDILCATLAKKCEYAPNERDMVILEHKFEVQNADGSTEWRTSTLCAYGDPDDDEDGYSAMAKLVGIPCGVAVKLVLDGKISDKGILAPISRKINDPLIAALKMFGIKMEEKTLA